MSNNDSGLMLAHCLRNWNSINPTLDQRLVFAGQLTDLANVVLIMAEPYILLTHESQEN